MIPQKTSLAVHGVIAGEPLALRIDDASIVFTIESAVARANAFTLDRSDVLVASRAVLTVESSSASRVAVLGFAAVIEAAHREYAELGFDRAKLARWLRAPSLLPRTVWLHELLHRYVFERHALGKITNVAIEFLEIEIAKEIYFLFRDRESGDERATIVRVHSVPVARALLHIEAHLTSDVDVAALARVAGASTSTLLRQFRSEVGCSPGAYWRNRKLDEALIWLRGGRSVADVATRAGYENPTAFGFAFRRRFGKPPSKFRPGEAARAPRSRAKPSPRRSPSRGGRARSG